MFCFRLILNFEDGTLMFYKCISMSLALCDAPDIFQRFMLIYIQDRFDEFEEHIKEASYVLSLSAGNTSS